MLEIFHLSRQIAGYDEAYGFVIIAHSEDEARRMAGDEAGDEGHYAWLDQSEAVLETLAETNEENPRIVLRGFNAG